jgi:hypothetical protein
MTARLRRYHAAPILPGVLIVNFPAITPGDPSRAFCPLDGHNRRGITQPPPSYQRPLTSVARELTEPLEGGLYEGGNGNGRLDYRLSPQVVQQHRSIGDMSRLGEPLAQLPEGGGT